MDVTNRLKCNWIETMSESFISNQSNGVQARMNFGEALWFWMCFASAGENMETYECFHDSCFVETNWRGRFTSTGNWRKRFWFLATESMWLYGMLELERIRFTHNNFETVCIEVGVKSLRQHHQMLSAERQVFNS